MKDIKLEETMKNETTAAKEAVKIEGVKVNADKEEKPAKVTKTKAEKEVKDVVEKKPAAKKPTKKTTKDPVVKVELQFEGDSYDIVEKINKVKEAFKQAKEISIYVKPEDKMLYLVVDGETHKIEM